MQLKDLQSMTGILRQKTRLIALQEETIRELTLKNQQLQADSEYLLQELQNQRESSLELLLQRDRVIAHLQQQLQSALIKPAEQEEDLGVQFEEMIRKAEAERSSQRPLVVKQVAPTMPQTAAVSSVSNIPSISHQILLQSQKLPMRGQTDSRSCNATPQSPHGQRVSLLTPRTPLELQEQQAILGAFENAAGLPESIISQAGLQALTLVFSSALNPPVDIPQLQQAVRFLISHPNALDALSKIPSPTGPGTALHVLFSLEYFQGRANSAIRLDAITSSLCQLCQQAPLTLQVQRVAKDTLDASLRLLGYTQRPRNRGEALEAVMRSGAALALASNLGVELDAELVQNAVDICSGLAQLYKERNPGFASLLEQRCAALTSSDKQQRGRVSPGPQGASGM